MSGMLDAGSGGGVVEQAKEKTKDAIDKARDVAANNSTSIDLGQSDPTGGYKTDGTAGANYVDDPTGDGGFHVTGGSPEERVDAIDNEVMPEVSARAKAAEESSSTNNEPSPPAEIAPWLEQLKALIDRFGGPGRFVAAVVGVLVVIFGGAAAAEG